MAKFETPEASQNVNPPYIGAVLRNVHEAVRDRLLREANNGGFDIVQAEFAVFQYPGPDGVRPAELARRCNLRKQAMNYTLSGLEARGYITRETVPGRRATFIRSTGRGRALMSQFRATMAQIETEWSGRLGEDRFAELSATLYDLAVWLGKLPARPHSQ